jgi:conjugal transfer pilus assembly protein TraD
MFGRKEKKRADEFVVLGKGVDMDDPTRMIDIVMPDSYRKGHKIVFGATRSGKSKSAESSIEQDLRAGRSVIYMDPKPDNELLSKIIQTAVALDREEELMLITPIFPEYSAVIDPLSHYFMVDELMGHTVSGIKEGKDPYFRNVAKNISMCIISGEKLIAEASGRRMNINLNKIKKRISRTELEILKGELTSLGTAEADELADDIQRLIEAGQDFFSKVASSLTTAILELTGGNIGKIIGLADENRFMKRLEEGKRVICVVQLAALMTNEASATLGKVFLSMLRSFVGRAFASKRQRMTPPLCLYMDEGHRIFFPGIEDLFSMGGGCDLWITCMVQSYSQIIDAVGEDKARTILDNTNTKMFFRVPDFDTAEYVAKHFGVHKILSPIMNANGGITSRETEEDVIKPQNILRLRTREFYLMTYANEDATGRFRGVTNDVSPITNMIELPDTPADVVYDTSARDKRESDFYSAVERGEEHFSKINHKYHDELVTALSGGCLAVGVLVTSDGDPSEFQSFKEFQDISLWLFGSLPPDGLQKSIVVPPNEFYAEES